MGTMSKWLSGPRGWATAGAAAITIAGLAMSFGYWGGREAGHQASARLGLVFPALGLLPEADRVGIVTASIKCRLNEVPMGDGRQAVEACLRREVSEDFKERLEVLLAGAPAMPVPNAPPAVAIQKWLVAQEVERREGVKADDVKITQAGLAQAAFRGGTATVQFGFHAPGCAVNDPGTASEDCLKELVLNPLGFTVLNYVARRIN